MRDRIVMLKHEVEPFNDRAGDALAKRGYIIDWRTPFDDGKPIGALDDDVAGTIVYGGPYRVADAPSLPFYRDELRWMEDCMKADVPVLGFCQGAQMIAHILGAAVGPAAHGHYEFGYYPVFPTAQGMAFIPAGLHVAQAHFHTFDIPRGAVHLARSALFENQAFSYGDNVFGLQFHAEITRDGFSRWQDEHWGEYYGKPGAQTREEQDRLAAQHDAAQDHWFRNFIAAQFPVIE